ncbi:MAG: hypothetical protein HPY82_15460 [Gammaproteobacteria bacterium]|nr:hypothetical protein [Gammaproteobacteria bacterium]
MALNHMTVWCAVWIIALLSGCGGGEYKLSGEVTGLENTTEKVQVTLNDGLETLRVGNGKFAFTSALKANSDFTIALDSFPFGTHCSANLPAGKVSAATKNALIIDCNWYQQSDTTFDEYVPTEGVSIYPKYTYLYVPHYQAADGKSRVKKYDAAGQLVSETLFNDVRIVWVNQIIDDAEGNIYIIGYGRTVTAEDYDWGKYNAIIISFDSTGSLRWYQRMGEKKNAWGMSGVIIGSELYMVSKVWNLHPFSQPNDVWEQSDVVVSAYDKTTGNWLWNSAPIGDLTDDGTMTFVAVDADGNLVFPVMNGRFQLHRFSPAGRRVVQMAEVSIPGSPGFMRQTRDGGLVLVGNTQGDWYGQPPVRGQDGYIAKFNSAFELEWSEKFKAGAFPDQDRKILTRSLYVGASGDIWVGGYIYRQEAEQPIPHSSYYLYNYDSFITSWSESGKRRVTIPLVTDGIEFLREITFASETNVAAVLDLGTESVNNLSTVRSTFSLTDYFEPCTTADNDADGLCDYLDSDDDADGFADAADACPLVFGTEMGCN